MFGRRKQTSGTVASRAAVLACALCWLAAGPASAAEYALLPALKTDLALEGLLLDIVHNGKRMLVAGEQGHILFSDDSGHSWVHADVPVSLAITSIGFAGQGQAWATAHDGFLLRSTDNGTTWHVKLTGSDIARLSVGAIEERIVALQDAVNNASPDNREELEWVLFEAQFALEEAQAAIDEGMTSPLLYVWFADDNNGYAVGAYGTVLRTRDAGASWVSEGNRIENPDNYHFYAVTRSNAGTLLMVGEAGTLLRSLDGGNEWERIETPYAGSFFGAVAASDGGLLIFGLRGNVFRSMDEGASWAPVDTGDHRTLMCGMAGDDGSVILAGAAGAVLRSNDAGASFSVIPTQGNRVYSGVTKAPDGRVLLVGFGGISILAGTDDE